MTKIEDPPLRSPRRTPGLASRWRTGGGGGSVSWNTIILPPWFFSPKMWFYSIRVEVCGATRWGQPTWVRQEGACPGGLCPPRCPLRWLLAPEILFYYIKNPRKVSFHSENFYFCTKNNTMVVLLKTASVRVSFIQIMQIRVQIKRKSVRKSRYDGDISTPPSLNLCLSSSNSVDKLSDKEKLLQTLFALVVANM